MGGLFFLFMTFASFSTVIAVFENLLAGCIDNFGWSRKKAALFNGVFLLLASMPCVLGYNLWYFEAVLPNGAVGQVLDIEDFLVSNLLLPLGSLVYLLFCVTKWGWGWDKYLAEANAGEGIKMPRWLKPVFQFVLPILVLVVACVIGMIYSGGFFSGENFVDAFSNSDASVGLMLGSAFGLLFAFLYYLVRRSMSFKEMMGCIPEGFKAMVPAILILTFAWSLKGMTDSLGAKFFVRDFVRSASGIQVLLPVIVFAVGCLLAFATGTSWGTFGILIPIVQNVFDMSNPMAIICISACMAGAVCGDHCSPISDTTIMASAGAQCDHVNHVSTQLPYAISCAVISGIAYVIAGVLAFAGLPGLIALPIGVALVLGFLFVMKRQNA